METAWVNDDCSLVGAFDRQIRRQRRAFEPHFGPRGREFERSNPQKFKRSGLALGKGRGGWMLKFRVDFVYNTWNQGESGLGKKITYFSSFFKIYQPILWKTRKFKQIFYRYCCWCSLLETLIHYCIHVSQGVIIGLWKSKNYHNERVSQRNEEYAEKIIYFRVGVRIHWKSFYWFCTAFPINFNSTHLLL